MNTHTNSDVNVIFVIPARGGSKRLPRKNIRLVNGKPCVYYAIKACTESSYYNNNVFVSTEDDEISIISKSFGANVIKRPKRLAEDNVWTQDVLKHAVKKIEKQLSVDIVVRVQANSPQVTGDKIDQCIKKLLDNNLWEVFTVNENLIEDAAIHVLIKKCIFQKALSVYKGVLITDYIDVHTELDLLKVEEKIK